MNLKNVVVVVVVAVVVVQTTFAYPKNAAFFKGLSLAEPSCVGKCTQGYVPSDPCQCNSQCTAHNNCCSDYTKVCATCNDRCGQSADQKLPCQCNTVCEKYNDCCEDYSDLCGGSDKPSVTDQDLAGIAEKLAALEVNNVGSEIVINIQSKSTGCSNDVAPQNLFTSVNEAEVLSKATFAAFVDLMDNYAPDATVVEDHTASEKAEEDKFLDLVLETDVMQAAFQFMVEKELFTGSMAAFKTLLSDLWFGLYDRDGTSKDVLGSSGFEHVFIGEHRDNGVLGFHNWLSFYFQEKKGAMNYYGYIDNTDFGQEHGKGWSGVFTWNRMSKCYGSMTVGTSPELELALYTICFHARPESQCKMTINGVPILIQTFPMVYKGKTYVGTSYCDWK